MVEHKKPVEKDAYSGVETTGHDWDGIKELNNPAPRWWLIVFIICCIWAAGYWVIYPAWPTLSGNTQGVAGWTQYKKLAEEQAEITAIRGGYAGMIEQKSLTEIKADQQLYAFAISGGKTIFKENCAACHGTGAQGGRGYPNLNDDDWLWGGKLDDIYTTLKHGIRSTSDQTRMSQMPSFGSGMLTSEQIKQTADHVLSLSGKGSESVAGAEIFKQNCAACHGETGHGNRDLGAPNLTDAIWLYGSSKDSIVQQIITPRHGVMPAWEARLPDATIKQLTIYVHSLGGGEADASAP